MPPPPRAPMAGVPVCDMTVRPPNHSRLVRWRRCGRHHGRSKQRPYDIDDRGGIRPRPRDGRGTWESTAAPDASPRQARPRCYAPGNRPPIGAPLAAPGVPGPDGCHDHGCPGASPYAPPCRRPARHGRRSHYHRRRRRCLVGSPGAGSMGTHDVPAGDAGGDRPDRSSLGLATLHPRNGARGDRGHHRGRSGDRSAGTSDGHEHRLKDCPHA